MTYEPEKDKRIMVAYDAPIERPEEIPPTGTNSSGTSAE